MSQIKLDKTAKLNLLKNAIQSYPDFPKPGITFRDIFGVFRNMRALRAMKDLVVDHVLFLEVDLIVCLDSRGFLFGPMVCLELGKPFLPIRKKGKLPGKTKQQTYTMEYGEATCEIQTEYVQKGMRVLILDDLLATGGTMAAAVQLLKSLEAEIVECFVIIELLNLKGREAIDAPVYSLIQYDT